MSLSSGEMGDSSVSVERRLNAELELAEAWRAVLLLDEADVFMAKRDEKNMVQNAITSVFLRKLEYYQGILLLTTNRLDSVDPAFRSRIHFCFHYLDLDDQARGLVWQTFLTKAAAKGDVRIEISDEERKLLAGRRFNGRQIKNIVSVSRAYALQNGNAISLNIIEMAANFSQFPPVKEDNKEDKENLISLI
jgi:SpoVK/Ycf46/Vps4 family AAA+-type ATPase